MVSLDEGRMEKSVSSGSEGLSLTDFEGVMVGHGDGRDGMHLDTLLLKTLMYIYIYIYILKIVKI